MNKGCIGIYLKLSLLFMIVTKSVLGQEIDQSALDKTLQKFYSDSSAPGIAVQISQAGLMKYHYETGVADMKTKQKITQNTHFRMASVSKQVTAQAIYNLFEQGRLKPTDPLPLFFRDLPVALQHITVGQLLQHSSGIIDYEELIPEARTAQVSDADVLEYVKQANHGYFPAGSQFRYSNTGYCLLALIVEQVSKMSFAQFVKDQLFDRIGIHGGTVYSEDVDIPERAFGYHQTGKSFGFADQSVTSATQGDGGVYFSSSAYHQWANYLLQKRFQDLHWKDLLCHGSMVVRDGIAYGMGWFVAPAGTNKIFFHSGESTGFHNIVYIDQQKRLVVTLFSNRDDLLIADAFDSLLDVLKIEKPFEAMGNNQTLFGWLNAVYANQEGEH